MRELVEFHCNDCDGYFRVNLNLAVEGDFLVVCPKCGREHPRSIKAGKVVGDVIERIYRDGVGGRMARNSKEGVGDRIIVPMSAYSKESMLERMERGGFMAQLWLQSSQVTSLSWQ